MYMCVCVSSIIWTLTYLYIYIYIYLFVYLYTSRVISSQRVNYCCKEMGVCRHHKHILLKTETCR